MAINVSWRRSSARWRSTSRGGDQARDGDQRLVAAIKREMAINVSWRRSSARWRSTSRGGDQARDGDQRLVAAIKREMAINVSWRRSSARWRSTSRGGDQARDGDQRLVAAIKREMAINVSWRRSSARWRSTSRGGDQARDGDQRLVAAIKREMAINVSWRRSSARWRSTSRGGDQARDGDQRLVAAIKREMASNVSWRLTFFRTRTSEMRRDNTYRHTLNGFFSTRMKNSSPMIRTLSSSSSSSMLLVLVALVSGEEVFRRADANGDGVLDLDEFQRARLGGPGDGFIGMPVPRRFRGQASLPMIDDASFYKAFVNSLGMIWATEVGDKTFFIAAVLAMRNSRFVVFSGALFSLAIMTVLSAALGYALPSLLPRKYTHYASAALFLYFGLRMLRDASTSRDGPSEELVEVEEELVRKKEEENGDIEAPPSKRTGSRVFTQAFFLTFLAEWGDRSQIATIALASAKDPYGVILGGITGHAMCTGLAVLGGRMLASRISERTVALVGGLLFLLFAIYSFFFEAVPDDIPILKSPTS
ncbi:hypothetical protein CTAYLR_003799 [Chrysophaeum taylorii]|uniref:EF-hand domain-containing protein n=1 Tax=Chrysophaeum taylorii TaxID=2483200 RepID=A0AAD7UEW7_9STRA|nr:hypothetical protein CTAYLR_003799 [Chrysophaeum taylorii]